MLASIESTDASSVIFQHLVDGNEQACREVLDRLREEHDASVLSLCEVLTEAFHKVGEAWECGGLEVYREHIASQIGHRLLLDLNCFLPHPAKGAPIAFGCTPEHDPYNLPTLMVELTLRELGFRAQSLGTNLPLEMLKPAIEKVQPSLCWVSISFVSSMDRLSEQLSMLACLGRSRGVKILCGGRALADEVRQGVSDITFLTELRELELHV